MYNMILFRYRAPGLPCVLEYLQNTAKGCVRLAIGYIHCKQSAWFRGCKLLRATPPPSSLTRLAPPHSHYSYRHQNSAFGGSSMCDLLGVAVTLHHG